ncbi:MAG: WbqC family protein [Proteiniphilum sp.]|nr:WbqC family protein [Proteiniphilum sp.]
MNREKKRQTVLLTSCYLAPVAYYSLLYRADRALIETGEHYQKQSYRNRCHIAGANGMLSLTIPVKKPEREQAAIKDIRIADHGNWQHLHWNAIVSAYRSTPFFRYYEDDFRPFYEKKPRFLLDFNEELRQLVCHLIGIEGEFSFPAAYMAAPPADICDYREAFHPKRASQFRMPPYYQVFADKNGFIPNLSIIDLLFNMGNESRLVLKKIEVK